jgi:CRP/FNR family transcriptional regulator
MLDSSAFDRKPMVRMAMPFGKQSEAGNQLRLGKHRAVYLAGDDADRVFEVESGAVMLYRVLDDGRRQVVEIVFRGGICGLTAGESYSSSCETLMPSVLRCFKRTELARSDALRAHVGECLQAQISRMHDHTVSLGRKTAEERVCTLILRLQELAGGEGGQAEAVIALPLTRTEIADYLGLTLETVCRTLTNLAKRKVVEPGDKKSEFRVPSLSRLRQVACCDA